MFKDGLDRGYKDRDDWWSNPEDPDRYRYADPIKDYPREYFPLAEPPEAGVFAHNVISVYRELTGKKPSRIMEFGCGGGWFLKAFMNMGYNIHGYDASPNALAECVTRDIPLYSVDLIDLRFPIERKFAVQDTLVIACEALEHVEPPFHGTVVNTLVRQGNFIWFSSEPPRTNRPHLHHPGEQPLEYWKALFKFFGFACHMLPDDLHAKLNERARCVFYKPSAFANFNTV